MTPTHERDRGMENARQVTDLMGSVGREDAMAAKP